jgi:nucleoside-diphosphate-sugar epimerase
VDIAARLFELHARVTHAKEPLLTRYSAGVLAFSQTLDISAICDELGYSPKISIDEGIKRHAAWHAENQE